MPHYPYKAVVGWKSGEQDMWWPVSSDPDDNMVIGDGIPGDKKTAKLCARCCNIAYDQALEDVHAALKEIGLNAKKLLDKLNK